MSAVSADLDSWSGRRWVWTVVLLLVLQIVVLAWLMRRPLKPVPVDASTSHFHYLGEGEQGPVASEERALTDPTLFAMANPHGFSGVARLLAPEFAYRITNQLESPLWLASAREDMVDEFLAFVRMNEEKEMTVAQKTSILLPLLPVTAQPASLQPSIRLEGEIADRAWLNRTSPPLPDSDQVNPRCDIRVMVDPKGRVFSAIILAGTGSAKTDEDLLKFVRAARFSALPGSTDGASLERELFATGTMVIEWLGGPSAAQEISAASR